MDNDRQTPFARSAGQHGLMAGPPRLMPSGRHQAGLPVLPLRRAWLQVLLAGLLAPSWAGAAVVRQRPLPPLAGSQLRLVVEFLTLSAQLQTHYVMVGASGSGIDIKALTRASHRRASQLLRRMRTELRNRIPPPELQPMVLRWQTVLDALITPPSLEVARLMLPMAREAAAPLQRALPAYDMRRSRSSEARARRQLLLAQLQLHGSQACWDNGFVDWPLLAEQRSTLSAWLDDLIRKDITSVRLQAQWNLFSTALPLRGARCLPNAIDTLHNVGEILAPLL